MSAPPIKVLVVDDEPPIRKLLRMGLTTQGYDILEAPNGKAALELLAEHPALIILDLGLPDKNGVEVVRQLREWSDIPVLVVTVRNAEVDKVEALDAGADDYLCKPFGAAELMARLRVLLRRKRPEKDLGQLVFDDLTVDFSSRRITRGATEINLTVREYDILRLLIVNRGKVVTYRQMLRELWGPAAAEHIHYLRLHMTHLRQKLEADPRNPRFLKTEWGVGYRFVE